jgi:hypothetical protein
MNKSEGLPKMYDAKRRYMEENPEKVRESYRKWYEKNSDSVKAYQRAYYEENKDRIKNRSARRRLEKPDEVRASAAKYRAENKDAVKMAKQACMAAKPDHYREMQAAAYRRYYEKNRDKVLSSGRIRHHANRDVRLAQKKAWAKKCLEKGASYTARRRALTLRATPEWAEQFFIDEAYRLARLRSQVFGFAWEVDHVIPLVNPLVCGLHVVENLRVVPRVINRSKGNRLVADLVNR